MSDAEINIAIAEWCGWKRDSYGWIMPGDVECHGYRPPFYSSDLNDMHAAEAGLLGHQMIIYQAKLSEITPKNPHVSCWDLIHATALQRSEALLRTLGLWKE